MNASDHLRTYIPIQKVDFSKIQMSTFGSNTAKTSKQSTPIKTKMDIIIFVLFQFIGPFICKKKFCDWPQSGRIKKKQPDCIRKNVENSRIYTFGFHRFPFGFQCVFSAKFVYVTPLPYHITERF